jgi:hypothetical protein
MDVKTVCVGVARVDSFSDSRILLTEQALHFSSEWLVEADSGQVK